MLIKYFPFLILTLFVILLTAGFWIHPLNLPSTDDPDALQYTAVCYSFIKAVREFNEFPVWNPYFGGGVPWAGMVWNPSISPMALILIIFGEVIGIKTWLFLVYLLAAIGMYLMCHKCLLISRPAGVLGGMLYVGALWATARFNSGNYMEFVFLLLPVSIYLLYCVVRRRLIGILLPFLYLLELGAFAKWEIFLMMPVILFFGLVYRRSFEVSAKSILFGFIVTFVVFIGLGMPKLLPLPSIISANVSDIQASHIRGFEASEVIISVMAATSIPFGHKAIGVGAGAILFVLVAFLLDWRKSLGLGVVLILGFLLTMGRNTPLCHIFAHLPIFDLMKKYTKYFNGFVLFSLCGLFAVGVDAVLHLIRSDHKGQIVDRWQWLAIILIFCLVVLPPTIKSFKNYLEGFMKDPYRSENSQFFQVAEKKWMGSTDQYRLPNRHIPDTLMYYNLLRNRGTITWFGDFVLPEYSEPKYVVNEDGKLKKNAFYKGEIYCAPDTKGVCDIVDFKFTYNTMHVELGEEFSAHRIVFNFNFNPGWSSDRGKIVNAHGLLALDLNDDLAPPREIRLRFIDKQFKIGFVIFAVTLMLWSTGYYMYCRMKIRRPSGILLTS